MSPPGTVLRDPDGDLGKRVAVVAIAIAIGVLILTIIVGFIAAAFVGLVAFGFAALIGREALRAAVGWRPPQLEVAARPYPLGSSPTVVYRRKPKRLLDIADCQIAARLICQEHVTYTQGTDTATDSRNVVEERCTGTGQGTAEGLVAELVLPISAHVGAPTMALPSNRIKWMVEIQIDGPRLPRDTHTFTIDVGAELDPSLRPRAQDS